LTPDKVKEGTLLWLADGREAVIILVNQHLSAPLGVRRRARELPVCESLYHM
jgi:hypothetical protein